jgi:restriction system protein
MSIPNYQMIMLPLLETVQDGADYTIPQLFEKLAQKFELSQAEREEMLPSGNEEIFRNRMRWARFYLLRAGLLLDPKRGFTRITPEGLKFLKEKPKELNVAVLSQFPSFTAFKAAASAGSLSIPTKAPEEEVTTPEESIEFGYQKLKTQIQTDLLQRVKQASPKFFERLVVELMVRLGYGGSLENPGTVTGKSGDEGIDGVIKEDKLGLEQLYIQAKRWTNDVSREEIHKFVGALHGQKATKGIFITTSAFRKSAIDYATSLDGKKVILIDGEMLTSLMFETGLGLTTTNRYEVKKLDSDYFEDEGTSSVPHATPTS